MDSKDILIESYSLNNQFAFLFKINDILTYTGFFKVVKTFPSPHYYLTILVILEIIPVL